MRAARARSTSDVFLTNKLPGTLDRLRIGLADIRAVNPRIIYVRGTSFGAAVPTATAAATT
jgi:crotonobetainyl-CoA:carnitine CoA-transferase CaiB-like acyl-CoA transferase